MRKKAGIININIPFTEEEHKLLSDIKREGRYSWHDLIVDMILNKKEDKNGNE